jgi:plasmid maintenance system antidote protein VapI
MLYGNALNQALASKNKELEQTIRNQDALIRSMAFVIAAAFDVDTNAILCDDQMYSLGEMHYEIPQSAVDMIYARYKVLPKETKERVVYVNVYCFKHHNCLNC